MSHSKTKMKPVAIIMGSQTDLKVMLGAEKVLKEFGVKTHVEVVSAHRTPEKMFEFATEAHEKYSLIIAGAGGAAHLPGMVASLTILPVIGIPITVGKLKGLDALLSIAQMPKGIPVASMAVENSENAGLLAVRILAMQSSALQKKLQTYRKSQVKKVKDMNKNLRQSQKALLTAKKTKAKV